MWLSRFFFLIRKIYGFQDLIIVFSAFNICRKSHGALSGSFHNIHHHKPEFCQLFILSGGKLIFLREENSEGFIEDDQGVRANGKGTLGDWSGKIKPNEKNLCPTASSSMPSRSSPDQWEKYNVEEIESYFHQLIISLNSDEEGPEAENETLWNGPDVQENKVKFFWDFRFFLKLRLNCVVKSGSN